jgi:hypothetical protein
MRGKGVELARTPSNIAAGHLLPAGDAFAFIANEETGPQNRVHVISFTGAPAHDIGVQGAVSLHSLDWLSDGSGFFSVEGPVPFEGPQLLTRQVTSKRNHVLFITPDGQSRVVWSPTVVTPQWAIPSHDGKHLAVLATSTQRNAWMLTNF